MLKELLREETLAALSRPLSRGSETQQCVAMLEVASDTSSPNESYGDFTLLGGKRRLIKPTAGVGFHANHDVLCQIVAKTYSIFRRGPADIQTDKRGQTNIFVSDRHANGAVTGGVAPTCKPFFRFSCPLLKTTENCLQNSE